MGDRVTALYCEGPWLFVRNTNGGEGFIPSGVCHILQRQSSHNSLIHAVAEKAKTVDAKLSNLLYLRGRSKSLHSLEQIPGTGASSLNIFNDSLLPGTRKSIMRKQRSKQQNAVPKNVMDFLASLDLKENDDRGESFQRREMGTAEVTHAYLPVYNQDLGVEVGAILTVLNQSDPNWWWVKDVHGRQGFVPSSYLRAIQ